VSNLLLGRPYSLSSNVASGWTDAGGTLTNGWIPGGGDANANFVGFNATQPVLSEAIIPLGDGRTVSRMRVRLLRDASRSVELPANVLFGRRVNGNMVVSNIPITPTFSFGAAWYEITFAPVVATELAFGLFVNSPTLVAMGEVEAYTDQCKVLAFPAAGNYPSPIGVWLTPVPDDAQIRFTTNGTDPTPTSGTLYTGAIAVADALNLRAIAYRPDFFPSAVLAANYTITPQAAQPQVGIEMEQVRLYRDWLRDLAPHWLHTARGKVLLEATGSAMDEVYARIQTAMLARLPATAPEDALQVISRGRLLERYPNETVAAFRTRVRAARDFWSLAGTESGVLLGLNQLGYSAFISPYGAPRQSEFDVLLLPLTRTFDGTVSEVGRVVRIINTLKKGDSKLARVFYSTDADKVWGNPTNTWGEAGLTWGSNIIQIF
jgi:hypothetical protein